MNKKFTHSLVAVAVGSCLSAAASADILITEYVSGSSYGTKAIEISNTGDADYTFTDQALYYQGSGSSGLYPANMVQASDKTNVLDGVTIKAGSTAIVIRKDVTSDLEKAIDDAMAADDKIVKLVAGDYNEVKFNTLNMTGDDSVFIASSADATSGIVDIIGDTKSWETDNKVYRRNVLQKSPLTKILGPTEAPALVPSSVDNDYSDLGKTNYFYGLRNTDICDRSDGIVATPEEAQGTGMVSPFVPKGATESTDLYEITGVVTHVSAGFTGGMYIQKAGSEDLASDAIFVKVPGVTSDLIGKEVCVLGKITEENGTTTLDSAEVEYQEISTGNDVTATPLTRIGSDGASFSTTLERFEGMLVTLPEDMDPNEDGEQTMRVSRSFSYDFNLRNNYNAGRNNFGLSYKRPNMQPNQENVAGSAEAMAHAAQNNDYRLVVNTETPPANGKVPFRPKMADKDTAQTEDGYIRVNDSVTGMEGVIHHIYGDFNLVIGDGEQTNAKFVHNTDRTKAPTISMDAGDGNFALKLATQNVLNFFNSPYGGSKNLQSSDNRGADSAEEMANQRTKLVEALYALDADVIGLMEIENNGFSQQGAIANLINALNDKYDEEKAGDYDDRDSTSNRYAFVGFDSNGDAVLDELDHIGGDAITTGIIYRPKKVTLMNSQIITMPSQKSPPIVDDNGDLIVKYNGDIAETGSNYQRDTAVAKFQVNGTGKTFHFAVNHFKSKGSTCWEDWNGWKTWENFDPKATGDMPSNTDFQGNCENFRVAAAQRLGEEMERIGGDRIMVGDYNAYAHEDPMLVLTSNPTGKALKSSAYTIVDGVPVTGTEGKAVTKSYGYLSAVEIKDAEKKKMSWSFAYNDEIGSLDHILISPSMKGKLIDAVDWHVNSTESDLYGYSKKYKGSHPFYADNAYRSSDHDPALMTLKYAYYEAGEENVKLPTYNSSVRVPYVIPVGAKSGDIASISVSPMPEDNAQQVALPTVVIGEDGQKLANFDVTGLGRGTYTFTMKLARGTAATASSATSDVSGSEVSVTVEVVKPDSTLKPSPKAPSYDGTGGSGSGGSLGFLSVLGLFGLGLFRRKRA